MPVVTVVQQAFIVYWKRYQARYPEQFKLDGVPALEPEHVVEKEGLELTGTETNAQEEK